MIHGTTAPRADSSHLKNGFTQSVRRKISSEHSMATTRFNSLLAEVALD